MSYTHYDLSVGPPDPRSLTIRFTEDMTELPIDERIIDAWLMIYKDNRPSQSGGRHA